MNEHNNESVAGGGDPAVLAEPAVLVPPPHPTPAASTSPSRGEVGAPHLLAVSVLGRGDECVPEFAVVAGAGGARTLEVAAGELAAELMRLGFPALLLLPGGEETVETLAGGVALAGPVIESGAPVGVQRTVRGEGASVELVLGDPLGDVPVEVRATGARVASTAAADGRDAGGLVLTFRYGWLAGSSAPGRWWLVGARHGTAVSRSERP